MSAVSCIAPDLTIRQVANLSAACAAIVGRYPAARDGERWSLQQLAPFAKQNDVDLVELLGALAHAANLPIRATIASDDRSSPMPLIFTALIVGLSLGAAWGVGLLLRIASGADYGVVPARSVHLHGVAQLWGWLALFVFGVASHLLRQNTKYPSPRWLDVLAGTSVVVGLLIFMTSLSASARDAIGPRIDVLGSSLLAIGALGFSISVAWSLLGRRQRPLRWHGFVLMMIAWLICWATTDLMLRAQLPRNAELSERSRTVLILLPVLGFATNAIYGFGIRLIPGLLNIARLRPRLFVLTLVGHNMGVALLLVPTRSARVLGSVLMLLSACAYVTGMNVLRSKPSRPIYGVDFRGHVLIRAAFVWLIVGLSMIVIEQIVPRALPHAYSGAWRHALTVGFVTTMILGVGHRVVPIFLRQPLASARLMLISAGLILVGNAGRVVLELLTIGGWTWSFRLMGITGLLELTALVVFGVNLAITAHNRRRVYRAGDELTPETRVSEAVNEHPRIQEDLRELGIAMFDSAPFIAPSMTFGALALASNMEPQALVHSVTQVKARDSRSAGQGMNLQC